MILEDSVVFPCVRRVQLCGSPVYEGISCLTKHSFTFGPITTCSDSFCCIYSSHSHSDKWNHSCINTMGSILCRICIRIMHKWNLSFSCRDDILTTDKWPSYLEDAAELGGVDGESQRGGTHADLHVRVLLDRRPLPCLPGSTVGV